MVEVIQGEWVCVWCAMPIDVGAHAAPAFGVDTIDGSRFRTLKAALQFPSPTVVKLTGRVPS